MFEQCSTSKNGFPEMPGSREGTIAGKRRIWYQGFTTTTHHHATAINSDDKQEMGAQDSTHPTTRKKSLPSLVKSLTKKRCGSGSRRAGERGLETRQSRALKGVYFFNVFYSFINEILLICHYHQGRHYQF